VNAEGPFNFNRLARVRHVGTGTLLVRKKYLMISLRDIRIGNTGLLTLCFVASNSLAQTVAPQAGTNTASLCVLQKKVAEGEYETARVSGLYGPGLDRTVLEDVGCPSESTWVELDLRSQENKKKLRKQLDRSRRA
jgi:hypothetical protein